MGGRLKWDQPGEHLYETGIKRGVLYPQDANGEYPLGVAWNGLSSVNENPSGAEPTPVYADNIKYLNLYSTEEFGCTINAFTYPKKFEECDGSAELVSGSGVTIGQQPRKAFGFCYRTEIGNEIVGEQLGYKLHLVYGCKASPSEKNYTTINDSPEANEFSWEVTTTPVEVEGFKPTSILVIDSTKVDDDILTEIEDILYGKDAAGSAVAVDPRLPLPDEILEMLTPTPGPGSDVT